MTRARALGVEQMREVVELIEDRFIRRSVECSRILDVTEPHVAIAHLRINMAVPEDIPHDFHHDASFIDQNARHFERLLNLRGKARIRELREIKRSTDYWRERLMKQEKKHRVRR